MEAALSLPSRAVAVVMLALITVAATASPPLAPPPRPAPRLDADGDPLPRWAVARIGPGPFRGPTSHAARLTPDGRLLVTSSGLFDPNTGKEVARPPDTLPDGGKVTGAWSAPDGRSLVLDITRGQRPAVRRSVAVWDVAIRSVTHEYPVDPDALPEAFVREHKLNSRGGTVAVGPAGRGLLYHDHNHHLTLWTGVATAPRPVLLGKSSAAMWGDEAGFTPDGRWVVQAGPTVRVWDAASGALVRQFPGPPDIIIRMALAPDGRHAAFLSGKANPDEQARHETTHRVSLWDLEAGKQVREFAPRLTATECISSSYLPLRFSSDGSTVVVLDHDRSAGTSIVRHWRVAGGQAGRAWAIPLDVGVNSPPIAGPDGKMLYLVAGGRVYAYDLRTGEDRSPPDTRRPGEALIGLTADGREVITVGGRPPDRRVGFWDRETGRRVRGEKLPPALANPTRFSPDARLVVVDELVDATDAWDAVVYDRASGRELYRLPSRQRPIFGSEADRVYTTAPDGKSAHVRDAATGKVRWTVPYRGSGEFFFSPDGRAFGWPFRHGANVYDARTGGPLARSPGTDDLGGHVRPFPVGSDFGRPQPGPFDGVAGFGLGPAGERLAAVGGRSWRDGRGAVRVLMLDPITWKLLWEANLEPVERFQLVERQPVAFSPDGSLLAVGGLGVIALLDAKTGKQVRRFEEHSRCNRFRFTPDGTRLISGDGATILVWDTSR